MPDDRCFICASDEGALLDATNNKQICQWIERCLNVKAPNEAQSSTKVCHKCAFEVSQCSSFLQISEKYKRSKLSNKRCCIICRNTAKDGSVLELSNDTNFQQKSFNKIQEVLNGKYEKTIEDFRFMCLSCLYIVDVLLDLRNVCKKVSTHLKEITNKQIDYLTFPKIETAVASRKTTNTESSQVTVQDLTKTMTRTRGQINKLNNGETHGKAKERCDVCHGFIDQLSQLESVDAASAVCASCQSKVKKSHKSPRLSEKQNVSGTKDCAVYLKDVLKNNETKEQSVPKEDLEAKKTVKEKDSKTEKKPVKQVGRGKKHSVETENEDTSNEDVPKRKKKKPLEVKDSPNDTDKAPIALRTRRRNEVPSNTVLTRSQRAASVQPSTSSTTNKKENRVTTKRNLRSTDEIDKSSTDEDAQLVKKRKVVSTSASSDSTGEQTRSEAKSTRASEESDQKEDIFKTETYICDECGASYENKLISLSHKLTHYRQPKLQLRRLSTESLMKGVSEARTAQELVEEPSENIRIVIDDDEDEVAADKSVHRESTAKDEATDVSRRETIEDDNVDITLVMKDSDEEQNSKPDEAEIRGDEVEDAETNADASLRQNKKEKAEDKRKLSESSNNNDKANKSIEEANDINKTLEEEQQQEQDITNDHIEDAPEQSKDEIERDTENKTIVEDKEDKSVVEDKGDKSVVVDKGDKSVVEDKENESIIEEDKENKSTAEDKDNQSIIESNGNKSIVDDEDNNQGVDGEKDVRENNEKESEIEAVQEEHGTKTEQGEKGKDAIEGIKDCEDEGKEDKTIDKPKEQNLNKSSKNIDDSIVLGDDSPKESNDSEVQELENIVNVQSEQDIATKEKSVEPEDVKSATGDVIEIWDSDSQDAVVLNNDDLNIVEDEDTVIVLEDEEVKRRKSSSDSANAAAEVLQEVLDLASAEFQKRQEGQKNTDEDDSVLAETLENISREVNNGVDVLEDEGTKSGES